MSHRHHGHHALLLVVAVPVVAGVLMLRGVGELLGSLGDSASRAVHGLASTHLPPLTLPSLARPRRPVDPVVHPRKFWNI